MARSTRRDPKPNNRATCCDLKDGVPLSSTSLTTKTQHLQQYWPDSEKAVQQRLNLIYKNIL